MKAVAVKPGNPNSVHLRNDVRVPSVSDIEEGDGVLVRTLKVGVDATDAEINEGLYGAPPPGYDYLILGHEAFGVVEAIGPKVTHVKPGDFVTCTVRRPGSSIYDSFGRSDITLEETYYERGINLLHGYLTEYFVDRAEYVVKIPKALRRLHVLCEPTSVCVKAIEQAYLAQRRLHLWRPQRAFVLGAGQIGLLTTLILRLRGLEVYTIARTPKPTLKAEIAEGFGARYISSKETPLKELAKEVGRPDLIIESTGHSGVAFEAMEVLHLNGVLVWTSITGGDRKVEIPTDRVNLEWVLGNKLLLGSVNSNWEHFEQAIADLALGEAMFPGVTERILTDPIHGLENFEQMIDRLVNARDALKVYVNVASDD